MFVQRRALPPDIEAALRPLLPLPQLSKADGKRVRDQAVPATITLVGVADNVSELVAEHGSIERALVQIHMPRMSRVELAEIVTKGMDATELAIDSEAVDRITALSQGASSLHPPARPAFRPVSH